MQGLYGEDRKGSAGEPVSALVGSHLRWGALAISGEKSKQPLHFGSAPMVRNTVESLVERGVTVLGRPSPVLLCSCLHGQGPWKKDLGKHQHRSPKSSRLGEFLCSWFEVRRAVWAFSNPGLLE